MADLEIAPRHLVMAVVVLVVGAFGSVYGCAFVRERGMRAEARRVCTVPETKKLEAPYLLGKVAVVTKEGAWERLLGDYLPPGLRAERAADITTCVVVEWGLRPEDLLEVTTTVRRGNAESSSKSLAVATAQTARVTVVDVTIPAVVAVNTFEGQAPQGYRSDGTGDTDPSIGAKPIDDIEKWLHALPRR